MRTAPKRISILIADDHQIVADGIAHGLTQFFDVLGIEHQLSRVIPMVRDKEPDVVLLDITFGTESSIPVLRDAVHVLKLSSRFLMLTAHDSQSLERAAFDAGATGFIRKGDPASELRFAVEAVAAGRRFPARRAPKEAPAKSRPDRGDFVSFGGILLSLKQLDVLSALSEHSRQAFAAESLGLTLKGLEYHLGALRRKTGIPRTIDLIRWFEEHRKR